MAENTSLNSNFHEQLAEHVFISEVLQEAWYVFGETVEVLRSEVDGSGFDVVMECNGILRHIQLKATKSEGKTSRQNVNVALEKKPSGCIVWLVRHENPEAHRIHFTYRFFGSPPGQQLPSLGKFKVGRHARGDAAGKKHDRPNIRIVNKGEFVKVKTTCELVERLFGLEKKSGT